MSTARQANQPYSLPVAVWTAVDFMRCEHMNIYSKFCYTGCSGVGILVFLVVLS